MNVWKIGSSYVKEIHLSCSISLMVSFIECRKGDYYRYLAEFRADQDRKEAADQSLKGYEASFL